MMFNLDKKEIPTTFHKIPKSLGCVMKVRVLLHLIQNEDSYYVSDICDSTFWSNELMTLHWGKNTRTKEDWYHESIYEELPNMLLDDLLDDIDIPKVLPEDFLLELIMDWDIHSGMDMGTPDCPPEYYEEHSWVVKGFNFILDPETIDEYFESQKVEEG